MKVSVLLAFIAVASPALAFECVPRDVVRKFVWARDSPQSYVVVKGRIALISMPTPTPPEAEGVQTVSALGTAMVEGKAITRNGFSTPFQSEITFEVGCFLDYCGWAPKPGEALMFLRKDQDGFVLHMGPCGGDHFANPKPAMTRSLVTCLATGNCPVP